MSVELKKTKREAEKCSDFDAATQKALEEIDLCQIEINDIDQRASLEILDMEKKYNQERKPWYQKRDQIISRIPNFWTTVIMNHPDLSTLFDDSEENCLHHLNKVEVEIFDDIKSGYSIKFHFDENPYFENAVLTKNFFLCEEPPKSESVPILWKEGCTLGQNSDSPKTSKKRRHESGKNFFTWYTDNIDPLADDTAEIIKEDIWLNPLQYYLVPDVDGDGANDSDAEDGSSSSDTEEPKVDEKSGPNRK